MVLGFSTHASSAGYPQQGYVHKEEYSKQDYYKDGHLHKEDYYKKDNYGNSSSMQMMRPHSSMPSSGHNHHGNGSYAPTNGHGYGHSGYSSGMPSHHGSGTNGYGNLLSSDTSMGPSWPQHMSYDHKSRGYSSSSIPNYPQKYNSSHGWISKDLDD